MRQSAPSIRFQSASVGKAGSVTDRISTVLQDRVQAQTSGNFPDLCLRLETYHGTCNTLSHRSEVGAVPQ
jgi:hypothetical protein